MIKEPATLVIYDIKDNRLRFEVAKLLRRFGLSRIQKSAFAGVIKRSVRVEVEAGLRRLLKGQAGYNVQIYVIPPSSFERRVVLTEGYELGEEGEDYLI